MKAFKVSCLLVLFSGLISCSTQVKEEIKLELTKNDLGESFQVILTVTNNTKQEETFEYPQKVAAFEQKYSENAPFKDPLAGTRALRQISKKYTLKPGDTKTFVLIPALKKAGVETKLKNNNQEAWFLRIKYYDRYSNTINLKP